MLVHCAYCGKSIDTDRQKYYSPSIWSGDTNYYCDIYNCYSKYRDKLQKERFEAQLKSGTRKSSGATYIPAQFTGYKEQKFPDGSRYVGDFVMGAFHGNGKLTFADGSVYTGQFHENKFNGKGKLTLTDGSYYEGDFVDAKRTGKGKLTWKNGTYYEGNFVDGKFQGYGKRVYSGGGCYEGYWANDLCAGKGKYTWDDGTYYEGDFVDGKFHGYGKYVYPSGTYYEGCYVNDKRTGKGKYTWDDGTYYEGDFLDDKFHGYGKKTSINGYIYEGEFQNNKRHGKGRRTSPTGKVREYYYENDKRVCEVSEATDEIITRIYGAMPPQAIVESQVETKVTATPDVKMASVSPAATETPTVTTTDMQEEPMKRTRKVASAQEIWDRLLKMTPSEKQEYFKKHHKLTIPAGTEVIPANCFRHCFELNNVVFNEELREIGEYAFASTRIRGKLVIPKSVEKIGNHAFDMSRTIEKVVLPNDITVGDYAFAFIDDLAKVEFESDPPEGVIIGKGAFSRCHKHAMKSKEMVEKIKALNKKAFK